MSSRSGEASCKLLYSCLRLPFYFTLPIDAVVFAGRGVLTDSAHVSADQQLGGRRAVGNDGRRGGPGRIRRRAGRVKRGGGWVRRAAVRRHQRMWRRRHGRRVGPDHGGRRRQVERRAAGLGRVDRGGAAVRRRRAAAHEAERQRRRHDAHSGHVRAQTGTVRCRAGTVAGAVTAAARVHHY